MCFSPLALSCTFKMGYRLNERLPLIDAEPSNEGFYKALFSQATQRINCRLEIIREPKKRLLKKLQRGEIDFYPGFTFTKERSQYTFYIENGLYDAFLAISHRSYPDVTSTKAMNGKVLLVAQGGPDYGAKKHGAIIRYVENLSLAEAVELLSEQKADFYIYNKASIEFHLKQNPNAQIKRHPCCGKPVPMHLGFSKRSPHFSDVKNTSFDINKRINFDNLPSNLSVESNAYKLQQAIKEMRENGDIQKLYDVYYN